jgi:hypothetical protein
VAPRKNAQPVDKHIQRREAVPSKCSTEAGSVRIPCLPRKSRSMKAVNLGVREGREDLTTLSASEWDLLEDQTRDVLVIHGTGAP